MERSLAISAGGHAALLGLALFGGLFTAEPLELPTVDVSVISASDFEALTQQEPAPQPLEVIEPVAPVQPEVAPEPAPQVQVPEPDPAPQTRPEPAPLLPVPEPEPEPVVPSEPESPVQPETVILPDTAPTVSTRPKPRPAQRVAPQAVAPPEPEVEIDNTAQQATAPDATAQAVEPEQSETAQEEAATEIVTEAETPAASALGQSPRPRARPRGSQQAAETGGSTADAVNAALAEALGEPAAPESPSGPPLSSSETNSLKLAVQNCWVVDVGSQASNVTVIVGMDMEPDGRVVAGSLRLAGSSGGEGRAVETAFQSARRAILRCQKDGYDLPSEKYEQWRQIEMTFNPKDMRIR